MNLTNHKPDVFSLEQSTSFSKYFANEDRFDDYNYSESNINETLLLEATHLDSAHHNTDEKKILLLKDFKEGQGAISREKSLVFQLCGDSYADNSNSSQYKGEKSHGQIEDLYNICRSLIDTLSKLQNKVQKMQEKDGKVKDSQKFQCNAGFIQKQAQSILTYSSLQSSNGCKCDSRLTQRDVISGLFEALQTRSKQNSYKEENQHLKKQIIRLQITNEELKKAAKRTEAENNRLRQLLRQYQNFNKRLVGEKQFEDVGKISRNHSQKVLSQRQLCHSKSNTSCFQNVRKQDQDIPFEYYNFSTTVEEQKQNLGIERPLSKRFEQKARTGVETPIENARSLISYSGKEKRKMIQVGNYDFQPKILFDPQTVKGKYKPLDKDRSVKISTFEQCRQIEPANDYVLSSTFMNKASPYTRAEKHSRTFRELKEAKLKISKRTEY